MERRPKMEKLQQPMFAEVTPQECRWVAGGGTMDYSMMNGELIAQPDGPSRPVY